MQSPAMTQPAESVFPLKDGVHVYLFKLNERDQISSLLVLRRADNHKNCIISGIINDDENPFNAAMRETREEISANPIIMFNIGLTEFIKCQRYMFKAQIFIGMIEHHIDITLNQEHTSYEFVPVPKAEAQLDYPEQKANFQECWKAAIALLNPNDSPSSDQSNSPPEYLKNPRDKRTNAPCMPERISIFNN
jgi:dihydroneopterin triphosphate diphosphatase